MANYMSEPDSDDYDVLIEGDLNHTDSEQCHLYDASALWAHVVPQLYTTVFLVGLLDNTLAAFILMKYKRLRHVENIYFLNLAVSNLCLLLTLPFWAHAASQGGILAHPMCKILEALSSVGLHSEALFSALLILQSHLVLFQVRWCSAAARKVPWGVITSALAWGVAILVTLPEFLSHKYKCFLSRPHFLPGEVASWDHFLTLKVNIVGFLVPLLIFIICFVRTRNMLRSRERKYDLTKLVFAVMAVFLLMWGPYNIALFLTTFKKSVSLHDCRSGYHLDRSVQVTRIIANTHSCVNPLLYVLLDQAFRDRLCCLCRLRGDTPLRPTEDPAPDTPWEEQNHSSTQL